MNLALVAALAALASCSAPPSRRAVPQASGSPAEHKANRLSVYLGQRTFGDQEIWDPVEDEGVAAVDFARQTPGSAVGWEVGLAGSYGSNRLFGADLDGSTTELYGGVRTTFVTKSLVRPVLGAGLSVIHADVEVSGFGQLDDSSLAGYVHGGVDFDLTDAFFLGLDLRVLFGSDIEGAGAEGDADYAQLALVIGFAF
jgi:hypothetical protein